MGPVHNNNRWAPNVHDIVHAVGKCTETNPNQTPTRLELCHSCASQRHPEHHAQHGPIAHTRHAIVQYLENAFVGFPKQEQNSEFVGGLEAPHYFKLKTVLVTAMRG